MTDTDCGVCVGSKCYETPPSGPFTKTGTVRFKNLPWPTAGDYTHPFPQPSGFITANPAPFTYTFSGGELTANACSFGVSAETFNYTLAGIICDVTPPGSYDTTITMQFSATLASGSNNASWAFSIQQNQSGDTCGDGDDPQNNLEEVRSGTSTVYVACITNGLIYTLSTPWFDMEIQVTW